MFNNKLKTRIDELENTAGHVERGLDHLHYSVVNLSSYNENAISDLSHQVKVLAQRLDNQAQDATVRYRTEVILSEKLFRLEAQLKALADFVGAEFECEPAKPARVRAITKVVEL